MPGLICVAFVFFFCFYSWRWWGKRFINYLCTPPESKENIRISLERKIEALKKASLDLKESDDEVKVSRMLEKIQTQLAEKEKELTELNKTLR